MVAFDHQGSLLGSCSIELAKNKKNTTVMVSFVRFIHPGAIHDIG